MNSPGDEHLVFVTAPNLSAARKLASAALKEKLVACANIIPKLESHYWWQGQIETSSETLVLLKTTGAALARLEKCVLRNHPYDTPEFIAVKLDHGNDKYLGWIQASVQE